MCDRRHTVDVRVFGRDIPETLRQYAGVTCRARTCAEDDDEVARAHAATTGPRKALEGTGRLISRHLDAGPERRLIKAVPNPVILKIRPGRQREFHMALPQGDEYPLIADIIARLDVAQRYPEG